MPATPTRLPITEEDIAKKDRGPMNAYAAIVVPDDYVAVLKDVNDHTGPKGPGYKWTFVIQECDFDVYTSRSTDSRWKLLEMLDAFDTPGEVGDLDLDPNVYIGSSLGAHVDWRDDPRTNPPKNFKEIKNVFSLSGLEDDEPEEAGTQLTLVAEEPATI